MARQRLRRQPVCVASARRRRRAADALHGATPSPVPRRCLAGSLAAPSSDRCVLTPQSRTVLPLEHLELWVVAVASVGASSDDDRAWAERGAAWPTVDPPPHPACCRCAACRCTARGWVLGAHVCGVDGVVLLLLVQSFDVGEIHATTRAPAEVGSKVSRKMRGACMAGSVVVAVTAVAGSVLTASTTPWLYSSTKVTAAACVCRSGGCGATPHALHSRDGRGGTVLPCLA